MPSYRNHLIAESDEEVMLDWTLQRHLRPGAFKL
jgi:hypothetical protein